jgi:hypothetical protein
VFENRVLRRIFEPKRDVVTGELKKLHNEELNDLYSSPNIVWVIKSRRMRWEGHVTRRGEARGVYKWVHTCNVNTYCNTITLQVTDTIRSYELNFHPMPHGITVSCECYTMRFPVCYGSPSNVFAASSGFVHLYTLCFKEKEERVVKATLHKQGSVQQFKFAGRLEFSVSQWVI